MADAVKITSHDLRVALKLAHPADEFVTLFEVPESSGSAYGSRADAIVFSLHASRAFEMTGFEFKCNRGDWLGELRNPAKADRIARYCDRWCLFAAPGVVKEAELPVGWGLWELGEGGAIRRRVAAAALEPEAMPRAFVASLLRSRMKFDPDDLNAFSAQLRREWDRRRQASDAGPTGVAFAQQDADRLAAGMRKLDEIRRATGVDLLDYTPSQRWIERMRLADSPRLEHKLRLLRDLFADDELRARIELALQPAPPERGGGGD